jgi:hypothetical protein
MLYSSSVRPPKHTSVLGKQFFYSSLYGWGIPFVIVGVGQILQHSDVPDDIIKPGLASKLYCWFNRKLYTHNFNHIFHLFKQIVELLLIHYQIKIEDR